MGCFRFTVFPNNRGVGTNNEHQKICTKSSTPPVIQSSNRLFLCLHVQNAKFPVCLSTSSSSMQLCPPHGSKTLLPTDQADADAGKGHSNPARMNVRSSVPTIRYEKYIEAAQNQKKANKEQKKQEQISRDHLNSSLSGHSR